LKKILVTGGFGFLGTHLLEILLEDPSNQITVIDNLSTNPLSIEPTLKLLNNPKQLNYEIASVESSEILANKSNKFDEIYHLASFVGPAGVLLHGGKMIGQIITDAYRMIDAAQNSNCRLLFVSTSEVYGGGIDGLCGENTPKIVPAKTSIRLEYGVGKIAAETAILNHALLEKLDAIVVRPFNVAGPRQSGKGGFVLPRFIGAAIQNQPVTVFDDGGALRAFTHVRDIAMGCYLAMSKGKSGDIYNLGNPNNKTTILDLAKKVIELTGSNSEIVFIDPKNLYGKMYEPSPDKYPDSSSAFTKLGWQNQFNLDALILDTFKFMKALEPDQLKVMAGISV
jgi:UDP-glucose 4-epimerase